LDFWETLGEIAPNNRYKPFAKFDTSLLLGFHRVGYSRHELAEGLVKKNYGTSGASRFGYITKFALMVGVKVEMPLGRYNLRGFLQGFTVPELLNNFLSFGILSNRDS